ncbi:hypothetical protein SLEP1_g39034 [Rubroshorea leprosula]|uniref:Uncharacterized protein n=1 Tax=Rubroshorea leprosula TaxID=152421 RepID=A0AAV5KYX7_9ROSI|nr:hypothetical protein SLEP1_g39034 [Rubroshorea leprosula]
MLMSCGSIKMERNIWCFLYNLLLKTGIWKLTAA